MTAADTEKLKRQVMKEIPSLKMATAVVMQNKADLAQKQDS